MTAAACARPRHRGFEHPSAHARSGRRILHVVLLIALFALFARPAAAAVVVLCGLAAAAALARHGAFDFATPRRPERRAPRPPRAPAAATGEVEADGELGALLAALADGIRDPLRAAQGLVRQMGEDPSSERNVDCARLALREIDRLERNVSRLLAEAREAAQRRDAAEART
jgi:signal transduction histidine kinase